MIAPCAAILMPLSAQHEPFPEAVQTIDPDPAWIDTTPLEHAGQVAMCEPFHVSHLPGELNWHIGMVLLGDPSLVPSLHLTGIGQGGNGPVFTEPVVPNPAHGQAGIEFAPPFAADVTIQVFDLSGSKILEEDLAEHQPGWHTVQLGEISPGV